MKEQSTKKATAALVLGIIALCLALIIFEGYLSDLIPTFKDENSGWDGVAAFGVLVALLIAFGVPALICGILAIVFGAVFLSETEKGDKGRVCAAFGLAFGLVSTLGAVGMTAWLIIIF